MEIGTLIAIIVVFVLMILFLGSLFMRRRTPGSTFDGVDFDSGSAGSGQGSHGHHGGDAGGHFGGGDFGGGHHGGDAGGHFGGGDFGGGHH